MQRLGFGAAVAVPDSWLGEVLVRIERQTTIRLVRATHEEEALAIACGARLGGVRTVMFVQNAGMLSMGAGMAIVSAMRASKMRFKVNSSWSQSVRWCILYCQSLRPLATRAGKRYCVAKHGTLTEASGKMEFSPCTLSLHRCSRRHRRFGSGLACVGCRQHFRRQLMVRYEFVRPAIQRYSPPLGGS